MKNPRLRTARLAPEVLEDRSVPAALTFVNDTWHLFHDVDNSGGLSLGDLVSNGNDGGTLTAYTYGTQAFGTVTSGPGVGAPTALAGFATINDAIAATDVGGTVSVLAGTYSEGVNVNKSLTLRGAQAGVDARTRTGAETVLDGFGNNGRTPIYVTANNVVVDGFTVQGATSPNTFGFGILLGAGTSGGQVLNNIVQNNIAGLSLANNPTGNSALISQNLFRNNNQSGPASGTAIYTDEYNAGFGTGLANVTIDSNAFTGNANAAVLLGATQAGSQSNITVSNNTMTGNGNGFFAFNLSNSSLVGNTITGSVGSQVGIGGGVNGLVVSGNVIANGAARGIRIGDLGGGSPNQNVTITSNSISGNASAGLEVADYTGTVDASGNWWGTATGPTTSTNALGTGSSIVDALGVVDYSPWLASGTDTSAAPGFQGDFAQLVVNVGSPRTAAQALAGTGNLQEGVNRVTVGGTVTATAGTYAESVSINKALTLRGAQAGVDARTRTGGPESVVGTPNGAFQLLADNIVLDGFTISGVTGGLTAGVSIGSVAGYQIRNNIITNNVIGVFANSTGASLIERNLFDGNNNPGSAGGAGIYSESTTDLTIDNNEFRNHTENNPILFAALGPVSHTGVAVTNNFIHDNVSGIFALGINGGLFQGNTITTGGTATALTFGGANTAIDVLNNDLSGNLRGVRVADFGFLSGANPNSDIEVHSNNLAGNSEYGLGIVDGYTGTVDASGNWWGTATGPTTSTNALGTGSSIVDALGVVDYSPWLASGTDTSAAPGFQGDFAQLVVNVGSPRTAAQALAGTGNLQEGVNRVTVGGTVTATAGTYAENVTVNKNLILRSADGRDVTTIQGVSGVGALGAVLVTNNTSAFTLGGIGHGFTVVGIDNGLPGIENGAVYFQGAHTGARIIGNDVRANGDHGLVTEFGYALSGFVIDSNIFSGQTFVGAAPATGNQFTVPNVARQLVVIGSGGGATDGPATNFTFTNNQITGTAGAGTAGNTLVTLDVANSTITGNTFAGATSGFGAALRVRRPGTTISDNTFDSTNMTAGTEHLFVQNNTTSLQAIVAANTFDRGVYVDGTSDLSVSLAGGAGRAATGSTLRLLPGTYNESLDLTAASVNKALALAPEAGGPVTITGALTLDSDDALVLDVGADVLNVTGTLTAGGATLTLVGGSSLPVGSTTVLVSTGGVNGTFAGLPQGGSVSIGSRAFKISYAGGNVTLTAPTPVVPPVVTSPSKTPSVTPSVGSGIPYFSGATVVGTFLILQGDGIPGGVQVIQVPLGTVALFTDVNGDGQGDVAVFMPGGAVVLNGQTGQAAFISMDLNGDGIRDLQIFNPDGTSTTLDGRTGIRIA